MMLNASRLIPISVFNLRRTDHSSELRGCTNQQAVHIRPVPAAGCAGAAEAAAAPPSELLSHTQPIAAHRSRFHLHHLVSLKGSVRQSLTSALQSSGPMPPCSAPPTPPQCLWQGSEVQHQAVITSDREAVSGQWKHFRVCFLFLNLEFLLSPRQLWWVMYCPLTFRVKRFDIFLEKNQRGNLKLWLLFSLFYVMKQRLGSDKRWMRQRPLCLKVQTWHFLLSYNLMPLQN